MTAGKGFPADSHTPAWHERPNPARATLFQFPHTWTPDGSPGILGMRDGNGRGCHPPRAMVGAV
jgi:hypothetical protein